jgi:hypothetical protein
VIGSADSVQRMSSGEQTRAKFVPTVRKTRLAATARPTGSGTPVGGELAGVPSSMPLLRIIASTITTPALTHATIPALTPFAVVSFERPALQA